MRKCYRCGYNAWGRAGRCPACAASLTALDRFRIWRRLRRFYHGM